MTCELPKTNDSTSIRRGIKICSSTYNLDFVHDIYYSQRNKELIVKCGDSRDTFSIDEKDGEKYVEKYRKSFDILF